MVSILRFLIILSSIYSFNTSSATCIIYIYVFRAGKCDSLVCFLNFGAEVGRSYGFFCDLRLKTFFRCPLIYMVYFVSPDDCDDVEVILEQI